MKSLICVENGSKTEITTMEGNLEQISFILQNKYPTFSLAKDFVESDASRWDSKECLREWGNLDVKLPDIIDIMDFCRFLASECEEFSGYVFRYLDPGDNEDDEYDEYEWELYCPYFSDDWIPLRIVSQYPVGKKGTIELEVGSGRLDIKYIGYRREILSADDDDDIVWIQCETEYGNMLEFNEEGDFRFSSNF